MDRYDPLQAPDPEAWQGLDRHDAVHAIGAVLSEHVFAILRGGAGTPDNQRYYRRLAKLTAKRWQQGKW